MTQVVVDASVLVAFLVDSGEEGTWAESIVADNSLIGPELVMVEAERIAAPFASLVGDHLGVRA